MFFLELGQCKLLAMRGVLCQFVGFPFLFEEVIELNLEFGHLEFELLGLDEELLVLKIVLLDGGFGEDYFKGS